MASSDDGSDVEIPDLLKRRRELASMLKETDMVLAKKRFKFDASEGNNICICAKVMQLSMMNVTLKFFSFQMLPIAVFQSC